MKNYLIYSYIVTFIILGACNTNTKSTEAAAMPTDSSLAQPPDEEMAVFTREQVKTVGIETGPVEKKELANTIKVNGELDVPNRYKALITPVHGGVVQTLTIHEGDYVKKGQVVATISNPSLLQIQQNLQEVNALIKMAELETARQQQLVEGNAAPLKKLQQAQTELATLKSQRSGLQKQLNGIGASQGFSSVMPVRAPISGAITRVIAQLGSNVDRTSPIAEIVDNRQLHLHLFAYEKDLPFIKVGQTIHFTLTNNPGVEYDAEVHTIGSSFEGDTRTVPVHAVVTGNKRGLIGGMSAIAIISLDKSVAGALPDGAIVNHKGQDYIFLVHDEIAKADDKDRISFEKIPVVKGASDLGYTQVTPLITLPPNAKVVTQNAFFVLAKLINTGEEADH